MAGFSLAQQPRFPVVTIDTDSPLTDTQVANKLQSVEGVTFCIRSENGHPERGGHFFCVSKRDEQEYVLETIEGVLIDTFLLSELVVFMNHVTGLKFDKRMLTYCQNSVNFRDD